MRAVRLEPELEARLAKLATKTHRTKTFYVKQALLEYLDEAEDIYIAQKRLRDLHSGKDELVSLAQVKKELNIEKVG